MASESISWVGCFKDMNDLGFSNLDCIREGGIENQLDAGATNIQIHLCKESETQSKILFIDNGPGMTEETLKLSRRLFNRKEASDNKNGCFGIGGSVASSQLTKLAGKAVRLSKMKGGIISQLTIDYPSIVKNNRFDLNSHEATKTMSDFWDKYAINKENGTIDILECPTHIVDDLIPKINDANLGLMYADYINAGVKITVHVNGNLHLTLAADDISDSKNALKKETHAVDVYINPDTNSCRAYFKNGKKQDVRLGADDKQIKEDPLKVCDANSGFKHAGTIVCINTARYRTADKSNWVKEKGGYYIKRSKKLIERFPIPYPSSGDYGRREVIASSRHLWTFPTSLDKYMGIEINKSRINRNNIECVIHNTLEHISRKFSETYWKEIQASEMPVRPMPPPILTETRVAPVVASPVPAMASPSPVPVAALVPVPMASPIAALVPVPANTIVPSQLPPLVTRPLAPLNPIPEQKPSHGIEILKDTNNTPYLSILHLKKKIVMVKCFGAPNLMKQEYEALLDKVGVDRFLEIIKGEGVRRDSWDI
jgi:hypothetical protein